MPKRRGSKKRPVTGNRRPIVFIGSSMSASDAAKILDAEFRPPICRGDLPQVEAGRVVGLVDGLFDQDLAVAPDEIIDALERGVRIVGAASMGALRAVELAPYGFVGVGRIFQMYRDEIIDGDDEVALVMDPQTSAPITVPLVNVRFAVEQLTRPRTISREIGQQILKAAKSLHYADRTYPAIMQQAGLADRADVAELIRQLESYDLKRNDAQALLEFLMEFASAPSSETTTPLRWWASRDGETEGDALAAVDGEVPKSMPEDSPMLVWELGDSVSAREFSTFLKMTGAFAVYAREALLRHLLSGGSIPEHPEATAAPAESLFNTLRIDWDWRPVEEVKITLHDLGFGVDDMFVFIQDEVVASARLQAIVREEPEGFVHAVHAQMFMDDIALKRELMRCSALRTFTAEGHRIQSSVSNDQLSWAKLKLCELLDAASWETALAKVAALGVSKQEATTFLEDLAYAQRGAEQLVFSPAAVRSLKPMRSPSRRRKPVGKAAASPRVRLRASPKIPGSTRFCVSVTVATKLAKAVSKTVGVTRVANITDLGRLKIPITQAYRPGSPWSTTVGGGKSPTLAGARIGAIMEEVEKYCQEQYPRDGVAPPEVFASFAKLRRRARTIDPRTLDLPYDSRYHEHLEIGWRQVHDLISDELWYLPSAAMQMQRVRNDILYSPRMGQKKYSSNGLGSAFTLEQAVEHATSEFCERHNEKIAETMLQNPGFGYAPPLDSGPRLHFVDLETLPPDPKRLVAKFHKAGHRVRILDATVDVAVPTFIVRAWEEKPRDRDRFAEWIEVYEGKGAHPDPEIGIMAALLEAAQTYTGNVSGAREDLTVRTRSLGRHERPHTRRRTSEAFWHGAMRRPAVPFDQLRGLRSDDSLKDVRWQIERLKEAGVRHMLVEDLTLEEVRPARVVKVVIPGLETNNPLHTGPRARAHLLPDLLHPRWG